MERKQRQTLESLSKVGQLPYKNIIHILKYHNDFANSEDVMSNDMTWNNIVIPICFKPTYHGFYFLS